MKVQSEERPGWFRSGACYMRRTSSKKRHTKTSPPFEKLLVERVLSLFHEEWLLAISET